MVSIDEIYVTEIGDSIYEKPPTVRVKVKEIIPPEEAEADCPGNGNMVIVSVVEILENPGDHQLDDRYATCEKYLLE